MYMIREVFRAQRGTAPELIAGLKTINQALLTQAGFSHGKIYADMSGPMDTIIWEFEAESLDQFFTLERGFFVNPDAATQQLIDELERGYGGRATRDSTRSSCSACPLTMAPGVTLPLGNDGPVAARTVQVGSRIACVVWDCWGPSTLSRKTTRCRSVSRYRTTGALKTCSPSSSSLAGQRNWGLPPSGSMTTCSMQRMSSTASGRSPITNP